MIGAGEPRGCTGSTVPTLSGIVMPREEVPVIHVTAALLDLANILGGFLLAAALLADLPRVGAGILRAGLGLARGGTAIGVLALVMGGFYLILHLASGPHVFHFELVGIGVGIALLRDRLFPGVSSRASARVAAQPPGHPPAGVPPYRSPSPVYGSGDPAYGAADPAGSQETRPLSARPSLAGTGRPGGVTGGELLLAVFGLIAIVVGIQGLFTPDT